MRDFDRCEKCQNFMFEPEKCKCKEYEYFVDGYTDESDTVKFYSKYVEPSFAAEDAAKHHCSEGECYNPEDFEERIFLRPVGSGDQFQAFDISADVEITYTAERVEQ